MESTQPLRQCLRVHMPLHYSYPNHSWMLSRLLLPNVLDNTWHINTSPEKIDHKLPALIEMLHHNFPRVRRYSSYPSCEELIPIPYFWERNFRLPAIWGSPGYRGFKIDFAFSFFNLLPGI